MATRNESISYGRGGAGNIRKNSMTATPDLATPSIKGQVYSTGRGGQGNMAKNDPDHPEKARTSQDVDAHPRRLSEGQSHYGRGGAANTVKLSPEDVARAKAENARIEREAREKDFAQHGPLDKVKGLADRGKEKLVGGK